MTSSSCATIRLQACHTALSSPRSRYSKAAKAHAIAVYIFSQKSSVHQRAMSPVEVSVDEIAGLAAKAGLKLEEGHAEDYSVLTTEFENLIARLGDDKLLFPKPDLTKYPRENVHVPEPKDADGGGWATKVSSEDKTML